MYWIGIDVGGTFTDVVLYDPETGAIDIRKTLSTPGNHADGVLRGLDELAIALADVERIVHGTTVATNTVLERNGARAAVVTTRGFRDVLEIGRGNRFAHFDFKHTRPRPLVARSRVFEVDERLMFDGTVRRPLDEAGVEAIGAALAREDVEAVVVCLLHSYANPAHERRVAEILARHLPHAFVATSSEVLAESREYERFATALLNVYVAPRMRRYLGALGRGLEDRGHARPVAVMTSSGGTVSIDRMSRYPVLSMLSGPASGVIGAAYVGQAAGCRDLVTYDMGGTSTDVCLVSDLEWPMTNEGQIGLLPNRVQQIEINSIGAGGGSIASVGPGGVIGVGPESAGAAPGPACYGRGGVAPTVTDANVVLGRLGTGRRLGGEIAIDALAAETAVGRLAERLALSAVQMADGIVRLAVVQMTGAIKEISVMRGHDPRGFALFAYGGAGPLHAAFIAAELEMGRVLVPRMPGNFSAFGLLAADVRREHARARRVPSADLSFDAFRAELDALRAEGEAGLAEEGIAREDMRLEARVDMRYIGQAFDVPVPVSPAVRSIADLEAAFAAAYRARYAESTPDPTEIVCFRVAARGVTVKPRLASPAGAAATLVAAQTDERKVWFDGEFRPTPVYDRDRLPADAALRGPALVEEFGTTTVVPVGFRCRRDPIGNLVLERE
jgi:N-methylhydantoinase A